MTGVSKTLSGSSILSSPALRNAEKPYKSRVFSVFDFPQITKGINQGIKVGTLRKSRQKRTFIDNIPEDFYLHTDFFSQSHKIKKQKS